jgi:hypothetical protein
VQLRRWLRRTGVFVLKKLNMSGESPLGVVTADFIGRFASETFIKSPAL